MKGLMNARRLTLAIVVSLCSLGAGVLLAAPVALAGESCPNEASRQGPSINLPECRVYEQVTPVDKGDAIDLFQEELEGGKGTYDVRPIFLDRGYAAEDGEAFLLQADASLSAEAPTGAATYVFSRGTSGWGMSVEEAPVDEPQTGFAEVFDTVGLSKVGFSTSIGSLANVYGGNYSAIQRRNLVGPAAGPFLTLSAQSGLEVLEGESKEVHLVGGSPDLSKIILESQNHSLAAGAEDQDEGSSALYETAGGGECTLANSNCKLVSIDPEGKTMLCGAGLGEDTGSPGGTYSAVSSDGSKVFFTAPNPREVGSGPGCWSDKGSNPEENAPQVYVRIDGSRTVEVSAPEPGVAVGTPGNPLRPAIFAGASADGSKVFFISETELTKDDMTHAPELYEYETETGRLTRVSHGESGTEEGNVDFVAAVASDGSAVYFTAYKALASGASQLEAGSPSYSPVNLYRYDTLTGKTTYITQVGHEDFPPSHVGEAGPWSELEPIHDYSEFPALKSNAEWYTTGDGQYLLFGEDSPITGFDNTKAAGIKCDLTIEAGSPKPQEGTEPGPYTECEELYRYNANAAEDKEPSIVCVSCFGGAPIGDAQFARSYFESNGGEGGFGAAPPRPISEDGEDVFFDSVNALVGQAVPGKLHVYEWHDGTISLISSPSDPGDAFFLGSSASGNDVFFATHAQLAPTDTDQAADIYDARVNGGFEGLTPSQCTGTGCQGVPGAPPIFATPASVTFEGVGNFPSTEVAVKPAAKPKAKAKSKPKKCKAGFQKKHGKCVKAGKKANKSAKGRK
jgi:hypothetical protein